MRVSVASFCVSEAASFLARRLDSTQFGARTFTSTRFGVFAAEAMLGSCSSRAASSFSSTAFFDDFDFYRGVRLGSGVTWAPLLSPYFFCYGRVYDVLVMDTLLRMLPHSPWQLAMDASMF